MEHLSEKDRERLALTGLEVEMRNRCGSFFQIDQNVVQTTCMAEGVEMLPIKAALEKYDWVKDYYWKAVPRDKDKYTRYVADQENPSAEVRSRRPLRAAQVIVSDVEGEPGWYRVGLNVRPHFKYMGADFTLSLVGKLDKE